MILKYDNTSTLKVQKSVFHSSKRHYNKLPEEFKSLPIKLFNNQVKKLFTKKSFYTFKEYEDQGLLS